MRPYLEKTHHKNRAGGVTEGVGSEFKPQYCKKKKKKKKKGHDREEESNQPLYPTSQKKRPSMAAGQFKLLPVDKGPDPHKGGQEQAERTPAPPAQPVPGSTFTVPCGLQ
jgi:hypothetical protein